MRRRWEFPGGSAPALLLIPVRPVAAPGTGVCDTGPWLTPGKAQPKVPKHGNPVQEGRIRLNGNGAGVTMLLGNWADTAAEGSQVNTVTTFFNIPGNTWRKRGMIQLFLRNEIPTFCLYQSMSVRWVGLRECWNLAIGTRCCFQPGGEPLESQ